MDDDGPDGWAVIHDRSALPPDGESRYHGFGPFPSEAMATLIKDSTQCECQKSVIPLFFPTGVTMMVTVPLPDIPTRTEGPVH